MGFGWIGEPSFKMPCHSYLEVLPTLCRHLLSPPMIPIQGQISYKQQHIELLFVRWNLIWNSTQPKQSTHMHHQWILGSPVSFLPSHIVEWEYLYRVNMMNMTYKVLSHNSSPNNTFQLQPKCDCRCVYFTNDNIIPARASWPHSTFLAPHCHSCLHHSLCDDHPNSLNREL